MSVAVQVTAQGDFCAQFTDLTDRAEYRRAYSLLMRGMTKDCTDPDYRAAAAEVLAAHGNYDEAYTLAEAHRDENPADEAAEWLFRRMAYIRHEAVPVLPAEVLRLHADGPAGDLLPAAADASGPVLLLRPPPDTVYFPAKRVQESGYRLLREDSLSAASAYAVCTNAKNFPETGPAVMLPDSTWVFTARSAGGSGMKARRLKLYRCDLSGEKPELSLLPFCKGNADYFHPAFEPQEGSLVFASDRAGGHGGSDLWKSPLSPDGWGEPENLGTVVNSPFNETYPHVDGDSLFFSSDRPDRGYGGADIYLYKSTEVDAENLGLPVNSPYNDFALTEDGGGVYYFASDRPVNGYGDAVFSFRIEKPALFFTDLKGIISGPENMEGSEIHLLGAEGDTLQTSVLGRSGRFSFRAVRGLRSYEVVPDVEVPDGVRPEIAFLDENDQIFKKVRADKGGRFIFQLLTPEDYYLERMETEDKSILDISIFGQYVAKGKEASGVQIILQDSEGEAFAKVFTEEDGYFHFESVKPDGAYTISAEGVTADDVIHLLDDKGFVIKTIEPNSAGEFVYVRLDPEVKSVTLTNELRQQVRVAAGDEIKLPDVYFDLDKSDLTARSLRSLNKLVTLLRTNPDIRVELAGHTDSRGSAEYNAKLSQKRIDAVVTYLIKQGVSADRISGKGYGEDKLRNHCRDGVPCTEDEHAENRRTEFKIFGIDD